MPRTSENLREAYLRWLESQLKDEYGPIESYWGLTNLMFDTPFDWSVPMDDNRLVDGLDLRIDFARSEWHKLTTEDLDNLGACSFLEVLIGLSRRMEFVAGGSAPGWAWQLLQNLELHKMPDPLTRRKQNKALEIMVNVIKRNYAPDGTGGFFPLAWPDGDATQIELWYQLNSYVGELHPEH